MVSKTSKALLSAAAGLLLVLTPGIANAAEPTPPGQSPGITQEAADDIQAVPQDGLRAATQQLAEELAAKGETVLSVKSAPYSVKKSSGTKSTTAVSAAMPSDCGLSVAITASPGRITENVVTSCTHTIWQSNKIHLRIVGTNPYNPFDNRILSDSTFNSYLRGSWLGSIYFRCNNTNATDFDAYANSTMVVSGQTYQAEAYDSVANYACGW